VLFSSLFASLAAWSRLYSDVFGQLGWINFFDTAQRNKVIAILAWTIPFMWAIVYLFIDMLVIMILFGGIVGSVLLFIIVFAVIHFRYKRVQVFPPGLLYDVVLWISIVSIIGVGVYGITIFLQ